MDASNRMRALARGFTMAALALALSACGDGGGDSTVPPPIDPPAPPPSSGTPSPPPPAGTPSPPPSPPSPSPAVAGAARLALGTGHAVAIRADGSALVWGANTAGQLGDGATVGNSSVRTVALTGSTNVAASRYESLALGADGIVRGWGTKFGNTTIIGGDADDRGTRVGTPEASAFPSGITMIVTGTGNQFAFALRDDGRVWHLPGDAQRLTTGARVSARQVAGLTDVVRLTGGASAEVLAQRNDGSVWLTRLLAATTGWQASAAQVAGVSGYTTMSCAMSACLGLAPDRTVWSFGASGTPAPAQVSGISDVVAIGKTPNSSHAITSDGNLWSWGAAETSGIAGVTSVPAPTVVPGLSGAVEVAGGLQTVLVRLANGTVWGFGANTFGELGTGVAGASRTPVQVQGVDLN